MLDIKSNQLIKFEHNSTWSLLNLIQHRVKIICKWLHGLLNGFLRYKQTWLICEVPCHHYKASCLLTANCPHDNIFSKTRSHLATHVTTCVNMPFIFVFLGWRFNAMKLQTSISASIDQSLDRRQLIKIWTFSMCRIKPKASRGGTWAVLVEHKRSESLLQNADFI